MSVVTLMAQALDQELQHRGIFSLTREDCEAIMRAVVERTAEAGERLEREVARK